MRLALLTSSALVLAGGHALAADVVAPASVTPAPVVAPEQYNWTGPYVGAFAGVTTGDFDYDLEFEDPDFSPVGIDFSGGGFIGGAQAGYDLQSGNWVFGAVADIAASSHDTTIAVDIEDVGDAEGESQLRYLGTVRARAGVTFDRALIYGHGGFAYGKTEQTFTDGDDSFEGSQSRTGWTIGAGVEFALTEQMSFGTEYAFVDLGSETIYSDDDFSMDEDISFHTIKAAVNFRF